MGALGSYLEKLSLDLLYIISADVASTAGQNLEAVFLEPN